MSTLAVGAGSGGVGSQRAGMWMGAWGPVADSSATNVSRAGLKSPSQACSVIRTGW